MTDTIKVTTDQGTTLIVSMKNYKGHPTLSFEHEVGGHCSAYFITTILGKTKEGLCLNGFQYDYHSISADAVEMCKEFIKQQISVANCPNCKLLESKLREANEIIKDYRSENYEG